MKVAKGLYTGIGLWFASSYPFRKFLYQCPVFTCVVVGARQTLSIAIAYDKCLTKYRMFANFCNDSLALPALMLPWGEVSVNYERQNIERLFWRRCNLFRQEVKCFSKGNKHGNVILLKYLRHHPGDLSIIFKDYNGFGFGCVVHMCLFYCMCLHPAYRTWLRAEPGVHFDMVRV